MWSYLHLRVTTNQLKVDVFKNLFSCVCGAFSSFFLDVEPFWMVATAMDHVIDHVI